MTFAANWNRLMLRRRKTAKPEANSERHRVESRRHCLRLKHSKTAAPEALEASRHIPTILTRNENQSQRGLSHVVDTRDTVEPK